MGSLDALSREFAREHSERLWKQLVIGDGDARESSAPAAQTETRIVLALAVAVAAAIKVPELLRQTLSAATWLLQPQRQPLRAADCLPSTSRGSAASRRVIARLLALLFAIAALFANVYPLPSRGAAPAI